MKKIITFLSFCLICGTVFSQNKDYSMVVHMNKDSVCFNIDYVDSITFPSCISSLPFFSSVDQKEEHVIDGIGDSMTAGAGGSGTTYLNVLQKLLAQDWVTKNYGIGGESAATILGRFNAIPYLVVSDSCYTSTSDTIPIKLSNCYNQLVLPLLQGYKTASVEINGVKGELFTSTTDMRAENADYFFVKSTDVPSIYISDKTPVKILKNAEVHNSRHKKIIWIGQNGGFGINQTSRYSRGGSNNSREDVSRLISMIRTYLIYESPSDYLILSPPSNTSSLLESMFMSAFGERFLNVRGKMVESGIEKAKELGLIENATDEDIQYIESNRIPMSFKCDNTHFNKIGYTLLAHFIYERIKTVWKY